MGGFVTEDNSRVLFLGDGLNAGASSSAGTIHNESLPPAVPLQQQAQQAAGSRHKSSPRVPAGSRRLRSWGRPRGPSAGRRRKDLSLVEANSTDLFQPSARCVEELKNGGLGGRYGGPTPDGRTVRWGTFGREQLVGSGGGSSGGSSSLGSSLGPASGPASGGSSSLGSSLGNSRSGTPGGVLNGGGGVSWIKASPGVSTTTSGGGCTGSVFPTHLSTAQSGEEVSTSSSGGGGNRAEEGGPGGGGRETSLSAGRKRNWGEVAGLVQRLDGSVRASPPANGGLFAAVRGSRTGLFAAVGPAPEPGAVNIFEEQREPGSRSSNGRQHLRGDHGSGGGLAKPYGSSQSSRHGGARETSARHGHHHGVSSSHVRETKPRSHHRQHHRHHHRHHHRLHHHHWHHHSQNLRHLRGSCDEQPQPDAVGDGSREPGPACRVQLLAGAATSSRGSSVDDRSGGSFGSTRSGGSRGTGAILHMPQPLRTCDLQMLDSGRVVGVQHSHSCREGAGGPGHLSRGSPREQGEGPPSPGEKQDQDQDQDQETPGTEAGLGREAESSTRGSFCAARESRKSSRYQTTRKACDRVAGLVK